MICKVVKCYNNYKSLNIKNKSMYVVNNNVIINILHSNIAIQISVDVVI